MEKKLLPFAFQDKHKYLQSQLILILKEYPIFDLIKIRYCDDSEEFIIDSKLLTNKPTNEHTINICLLGGISYDT